MEEVIIYIFLLALTTSSFIAFRMRRFVVWKNLLPILVAFILISAVAICFLARIHDNTLRKILGIVLIVTGLYFAFFSRRIKIGTSVPFPYGLMQGCVVRNYASKSQISLLLQSYLMFFGLLHTRHQEY